MRKAIVAALLAGVPIIASAEPATVMYVPRSEHYIPRLYVHAGTTVDVALPPGESLTYNPIVGDPRWSIKTFSSGNTVHVTIKSSGSAMDSQLVTIPGSTKTLHLIVRSGPAESTAYTVDFFEPPQRNATTPRPLPRLGQVASAPAIAPPLPSATSTPSSATSVFVTGCAAPMETGYRLSGDKRIDVRAVCDDGQHTYILVGGSRDEPSAVPYRVDLGGHQDQVENATFAPADASHPGQWIIDGISNHWALVSDSSRGQIRKDIAHE